MRTNQNEGSKAKLYWTIGIVAAILAAALLIWNSGIFVKGSTAATVGEREYSIAEVSYFYETIKNGTITQARTYGSMGIDTGYDPDLSPKEQFYNEEEGVTYADYFLDTALTQLQNVTILCSEAEAEGYTLSEAGQQSIQENMDALSSVSLQSGLSQSAYLKNVYGKFMTKSLFKDILSQAILADDYANAKAESFTYSDDELDKYYADNADDLDQYEYRSCYINYEVDTKTDDDGNPVEATDEETEAAMAEAKEKADQMVSEVQGGAAFNETAAKYVAEESAEAYKDEENGHVTGAMGNSLPSTFKEWLTSGSRQDGDITAIEVEGTGYCVVQFLGRDKGEKSYQTASYRNLLILAETTPSTAEDGTEVEQPTQEQLDAAKEQADALLEQWKEGGKDADTFAALVQDNSDDGETSDNGGLIEDADRSAVSAEVQKWLFAEGRKPGQAAVVEYTDSTGNVAGYQLLFAEEFGELRWKYQAASNLRSADYDEWYEGIQENYPAQLTDAAQKIHDL